MSVIIREAEEQDLQPVISLYAQPDMDNRQVTSLEKAKEIFKRTKTYPFFKVYIAVLNEEIIGTFELVIMDNLAHKGTPSGIIEDVVVSEQHQRKGIGKAMMIHAMKICKEMGCYKVALSSNLKREDAHKFYESLGFKKHGYSFYIEL
jgi:GNAT superfamily N-acetyltransferase